MEPIVLNNGNSINVGHSINGIERSNCWSLFFDNLYLLKNSMKKPPLLEFQKALFGSLSMNNVWSFTP
jgi:hypothetical protein